MPNLEDAPQCPKAGSPDCCDPNLAGPLECLDDRATVAAVRDLASAGIPVFVVRAPGGELYDGAFDGMALAGGKARQTAPRYYGTREADVDALLDALSGVAGTPITTCAFRLRGAPGDAARVSVFVDDAPVPADPNEGWTLAGATVTLHGETCARVLEAAARDVRIVVACGQSAH